MITTAKLAAELGITQFAIVKRIKALGIKPSKAGRAFVLTPIQAKKVRGAKSTPGPERKSKQDVP